MLHHLVIAKAFCFLFICQWFSFTPNSFRRNRMWRLHHNEFWLITLLSLILLIRFLFILDSIDGHVKTMQHIYLYIYIYLYICLQRLRNECPWNSQHFMAWKIAHPWWGSIPRSLFYISSSIIHRHVLDHQSNVSQIYLYISGAPNRKIVYGNDKNMNCRCQKAAILNFTICWQMVPFTAWHTADMDSAQKIV